MFILLQVIAASLTGIIACTFASETFAYGVSRHVETLFDYIEYKLALRDKTRAQMACGVLSVARETAERTGIAASFATPKLSL